MFKESFSQLNINDILIKYHMAALFLQKEKKNTTKHMADIKKQQN